MREYILTLCAAALILSVTGCMIPEGTIKKYAVMASSVMISLAVALPFVKMIDGDFSFSLPESGEYKVEYDAAERYNDMLKDEYKRLIEEGLSDMGRIYAEINDDLEVVKIEIYAERQISQEELEKIDELYSPCETEVNYE